MAELARIEVWPDWLTCAWAFRGVRESSSGDSGDILLFGETSKAPGLSRDEVPWCAGFVGSCLERAGLRGSRSLMAKSYLTWGQPTQAKPGAIAVYNRGSDPALGHVGFVVSVNGDYIWLVSGNVSNSVTVDRRAKSDAIAYRWPTQRAAQDFNWDKTYEHFKNVEGGLSDDPNDQLTNAGLIKDDIVEWTGRATSNQELKMVTMAQHEQIIKGLYWYKSWADQLPMGLDLLFADICLLQGRVTATKILQDAAGVSQDGEIGPATVRAAQSVPVVLLASKRLQALQGLSKWSIYANGWTNRHLKTLKAARKLAGLVDDRPAPIPEPAPQEPSEPVEVSPEPEAPPLPEQKPPIVVVTPKPREDKPMAERPTPPSIEDDDRWVDIDVKVHTPKLSTLFWWGGIGFALGFLVCKFWDKIGLLVGKIF